MILSPIILKYTEPKLIGLRQHTNQIPSHSEKP